MVHGSRPSPPFRFPGPSGSRLVQLQAPWHIEATRSVGPGLRDGLPLRFAGRHQVTTKGLRYAETLHENCTEAWGYQEGRVDQVEVAAEILSFRIAWLSLGGQRFGDTAR